MTVLAIRDSDPVAGGGTSRHSASALVSTVVVTSVLVITGTVSTLIKPLGGWCGASAWFRARSAMTNGRPEDSRARSSEHRRLQSAAPSPPLVWVNRTFVTASSTLHGMSITSTGGAFGR